MSRLSWRAGAAAVSIAGLAALAGCNEAPPPSPPAPPPAAAYEPPPPPPALLGAPPQRDFVAMAPIANPEDMSPAERARVYGAGYAPHRHAHRAPGWWLRLHAHDHPALTMRPAVVATRPATIAVAKPATPKMAAPTPVPIAAPPSPISQLAAAVGAKAKSATLAVPADLSAAKPGAVTLSLPRDLFSVIREEAAKLGLGRAARKTDVTATLNGDGYAISPAGPQTAHLAPGKPAVFTWQVKPGPKAKGPLTADVSALLKGAGDAKTFALAELKQAVAAVDAAANTAQAATHGFKLPGLNLLTIPGHEDVTLPVVGKTPSKTVVGVGLGLLLLFLLAIAAQARSRRREAAERLFFRAPLVAPVVATPEVVEESHLESVAAAPADAAPALQPMTAEPVHEAAPVVEPVAAPTVVHEPTVEPALADPAPAEPAAAAPAVAWEDAGAAAPLAETGHAVAEDHHLPEAAGPLTDHGPSVVGLTPAAPASAEPAVVYVEEHPAAEDHPAQPATTADHTPTETAFDHHHPELETV